MSWNRLKFRSGDFGREGQGDGAFFTAFTFIDETCPGMDNQYPHRVVSEQKRPLRVAWTGEDVKTDFFAFMNGTLLVSERANQALLKSGIKGFHTENLHHVGLAKWIETPETEEEVEIKTKVVSSLIRGFREMVIDDHPTFDNGVEIVKCPRCCLEVLHFERGVFDSNSYTTLTFPSRSDIATLPYLGRLYFASNRFRTTVENAGLVGTFFCEQLSLVEEMHREHNMSWLATMP